MVLASLLITLYEEHNIIINCKKTFPLYHLKKAKIREQNIFFFLNYFKKEDNNIIRNEDIINLNLIAFRSILSS